MNLVYIKKLLKKIRFEYQVFILIQHLLTKVTKAKKKSLLERMNNIKEN